MGLLRGGGGFLFGGLPLKRQGGGKDEGSETENGSGMSLKEEDPHPLSMDMAKYDEMMGNVLKNETQKRTHGKEKG